MPLGTRILGRSGIRVSDACLGTMTFGTSWGSEWGADEHTSRAMYETYREAGGNFVDTANNYTNGDAEEILGRCLAADRDEVVVSTKFTLPTGADPNSEGSSRKSLRRSIETSLRRLDTDYVDVLYVHAWDQHTPTDETLRALDDLVTSGKVLAIGISNTPAWVISAADVLAELRGWSRFCTIQLEFSLVARTAEREVRPMARALGLHELAWSPLARGLLAGKATLGDRGPNAQAIVDEAAKVAAEVGVSVAQIALAWVRHRGLTPMIGARTLEQLTDNLAAAAIELDDDHLARLDQVSAVPLGYPHEFLQGLFPQFTAD